MKNHKNKITVRGLTKSFGSNQVLRNLDLDLRTGESLVVIGASGTGKSVLIKLLIGILSPDSGSIRIENEELIGAKANIREQFRQKIGMLFQGAALFDSLTLWENVAFGLMSGKSVNREKAKQIAIDTLASVGLDSKSVYRYPAELSAGAQKRVGLARAIATKPEILFFDEPTTGIDPIMGHVIDHLIIENVKVLGASALTITHDMESAKRIGDRIAMLHEGAVVWASDADKIEATDNAIVKRFVAGQANHSTTSRTTNFSGW